jgi:hypothetical protein
MAVNSWIDHIFAVKSDGYRYDVRDTRVIDHKIPVDGEMIRLSDHKGYMSTIRIVPTAIR